MNEAPGQGPASEFDAGSAGGGASAGTMLRQAREAAGLQVETLAVALKVPVETQSGRQFRLRLGPPRRALQK